MAAEAAEEVPPEQAEDEAEDELWRLSPAAALAKGLEWKQTERFEDAADAIGVALELRQHASVSN